MKNTGNKDWKY